MMDHYIEKAKELFDHISTISDSVVHEQLLYFTNKKHMPILDEVCSKMHTYEKQL